MKRTVCFVLVLLLLGCSGCKSAKTDRAEETTAAAGESAGAPVENTQENAAPAVAWFGCRAAKVVRRLAAKRAADEIYRGDYCCAVGCKVGVGIG